MGASGSLSSGLTFATIGYGGTNMVGLVLSLALALVALFLARALFGPRPVSVEG